LSEPIHLWFHATYNPAYKAGGWAWARLIGGEITGAAGGEKHLSFERLELLGLSNATPGLPEGQALVIHTANSRLAILNQLLTPAGAGEAAPETELDVWARLVTALGKRPTRVVIGKAEPNTALGFASAWADLGKDRAKAGAFKAAIPKANLLRASALLRP
jgi:hypothetical protein